MSLEIVDGKTKYEVIHKFGRSPAIGTTYSPVALGNVYRTPKLSASAALRIKAGGDANDTAAGSGARSIRIEGLDERGERVHAVVVTAGASASAVTDCRFSRLYRAYVLESGVYSPMSAPAGHADDIVIENAAGSEDWATIGATDIPKGQSEIAAYTIPKGMTGFVRLVEINTDTTKLSSVVLMQRTGAFNESSPFASPRVVLELAGLVGVDSGEQRSPYGPFKAGTDITFLAKVSATTGEVDIDFEITLRKA